jgi:hypothetical protein
VTQPSAVRDHARGSIARMRRRLRSTAPTLAEHVDEWTRSLAGGPRAEDYFLHQQAFPMLLLPWWLEETIRGTPASAFQRELAYSTICGYYFVRLIDDLMDEGHGPASEVLPALIFFHTEFQRTYQRYFAGAHPFWTAFVEVSYAAAETASRDASLAVINHRAFLETSARKIAGAKIPIAAICHHYGRPDLLEPWGALVDKLGRWHQMLNDIRGWQRDLRRGRATYFLSEAALRSDPAQSLTEWVVGDGLTWSGAELEAWMDELQAAAGELRSPPLADYLEQRRGALASELDDLRHSAVSVARLAAALR